MWAVQMRAMASGQVPVLDVAGEQEDEREGEGVGEVVDGGADAGVDEVAEHEEVGREEEDGEEEPAAVEVLVGEEGEGEEDGFFDAEEEGGAGQHGGLYGIVGEVVPGCEKANADSSAALRNDNEKSRGESEGSQRQTAGPSTRCACPGWQMMHFGLMAIAKSKGSHGGRLCFDAGLDGYAGEGWPSPKPGLRPTRA